MDDPRDRKEMPDQRPPGIREPLVGSFATEPPVMWPSSTSGYEADAFSPAGTAQQEWAFARGIGRFRFGKLVVWVILGLFVIAPIVGSFLFVVLSRR